MIYNVILNLFVAHILADFYLQGRKMCEDKLKNELKGWGLWVHSAIVGVLSGLALFDINAWWQMLVVMLVSFAVHEFIDWSKCKLLLDKKIYEEDSANSCIKPGPNIQKRIWYFLGDQLAHIGVIVVLALLWLSITPEWTQFEWLQKLLTEHPVRVYTAIGLLLIIKPANILILDIFENNKITGINQNRASDQTAGDNAENNGTEQNNNAETCEEDHGNFHSGALIGYTERALMLIFVVLSQYEAIGLLIAAKSILRFSEASSGNEKSEYVLSGTLLSLALAVATGLIILHLPAV